MYRISSLLFLFLFCFFCVAEAQVGQSPYTVKGIGSLNSLATGRNLGMGGVGIGNSHYLYLNNMNPAMLTRNSFYTTFEAGLNLESRNLSTVESEDQTSSGGLDYLSLAFPVVFEKMTLNLGLAPYSTVSYDVMTTRPIEGTTNGKTGLRLKGSGGTSQAYAATGVKLFKGLSAGLRASYIFGAITEEIYSQIEPGLAGPTYLARYFTQTSFSDVLLTGGLGYRQALDKKKERFLMAGLTYDLEADLNASRISRNERAGAVEPPIISVDEEGVPGTYFLPSAIAGGVSYERLYHYTLAADVRYQNWEEYRGFNGASDNLGKNVRVALGGEWIPDYSSAKPGTYFKRMTYRMGLQYEKTPFIVNGEDINDFGINFGLSLPVSNASSIHTSFLIGQRGKTDNDLVRERYFRLSLGVTFNDRWFTKVKYD